MEFFFFFLACKISILLPFQGYSVYKKSVYVKCFLSYPPAKYSTVTPIQASGIVHSTCKKNTGSGCTRCSSQACVNNVTCRYFGPSSPVFNIVIMFFTRYWSRMTDLYQRASIIRVVFACDVTRFHVAGVHGNLMPSLLFEFCV